MKNKKDNFWPKRPGYNYVLGYVEGKPTPSTGGIKTKSIDRSVKDGKSLNK
jgi:hypothetical protein